MTNEHTLTLTLTGPELDLLLELLRDRKEGNEDAARQWCEDEDDREGLLSEARECNELARKLHPAAWNAPA